MLLPTQPAIPGSQPAPAAQPLRRSAAAASRRRLERTDEELERLEDFRERVLRRNPYKLDKWGILNVPELGPIPLAGLTAEEATRARSPPKLRLQDFIVRVTRLPLKPIGTEALKPFGYDLFAGMPSTFAPATDVPVPAEYVVGPGDTIEVQLIGNTKGRYSLVVGRDGRINFPELGPIAVGGRRFEEVRDDLEARVREQMIGTQASVGIGELRSIRVFVLGDAETPGSYTVSGLSTITNALFVSGGVKKIGSLRNIQLKRNGRTVTTLDLYDLLLQGRHERRRAAAAGRRDLHSAGRRDGRPGRRSAPAGDLRAEERNDGRAAAAARRRPDAGGGSDARDAGARQRAARSASPST